MFFFSLIPRCFSWCRVCRPRPSILVSISLTHSVKESDCSGTALYWPGAAQLDVVVDFLWREMTSPTVECKRRAFCSMPNTFNRFTISCHVLPSLWGDTGLFSPEHRTWQGLMKFGCWPYITSPLAVPLMLCDAEVLWWLNINSKQKRVKPKMKYKMEYTEIEREWKNCSY